MLEKWVEVRKGPLYNFNLSNSIENFLKLSFYPWYGGEEVVWIFWVSFFTFPILALFAGGLKAPNVWEAIAYIRQLRLSSLKLPVIHLLLRPIMMVGTQEAKDVKEDRVKDAGVWLWFMKEAS